LSRANEEFTAKPEVLDRSGRYSCVVTRNVARRTIPQQDNKNTADDLGLNAIQHTIQNLRVGEIPGPDEIENSTLKQLTDDALVTPLTRIYNEVLTTGISPEEWMESEIIILHKKGSMAEMEKYRPVSLSDNVSKVFMKFPKNRLYNQL